MIVQLVDQKLVHVTGPVLRRLSKPQALRFLCCIQHQEDDLGST